MINELIEVKQSFPYHHLCVCVCVYIFPIPVEHHQLSIYIIILYNIINNISLYFIIPYFVLVDYFGLWPYIIYIHTRL